MSSKLERAMKVMDEQNKLYIKKGITTTDRPIVGTIETMSKLRGKKIPTGDICLDYFLGGGLTRGTSSLRYGKQTVGKSFSGMTTAAALLKSDPEAVVLWVQVEPGDPKAMAIICGIDPADPRLIIQDVYGSGERAFETIMAFLMEPYGTTKEGGFRPIDTVDLVVLDSIGELSPREELAAITADGLAESSQGMSLPERMVSRLWRVMHSQKMYDHAHFLVISQVRVDIGSAATHKPDKPKGGNATLHASRVTLSMKNIGREGLILNGKTEIGHTIETTFIKEQILHRHKNRSFQTIVLYGVGVDNRSGLYQLLVEETKGYKSGGAWLKPSPELLPYLPDGDVGAWNFNGKAKLQEALKNNEEFYASCHKFIMESASAEKETIITEIDDSLGDTTEDTLEDIDIEIDQGLTGLEE